MTTVANALVALGVTEWTLNYTEEPTNEEEFFEAFTKLDDNPLDVSWKKILIKKVELIEQQKLIDLRAERDKRLQEVDYITLRSYSQGVPVPEEWANYQQSLRDITDTYESLEDVVWPTKPEEQRSLEMVTTISGSELSTNNFTLSGIGSGSVGTSTGSTTWDVSSAQTQIVTANPATTVTITNASSTPVGTGFTLIVIDASSASLTISASPTPKYVDATAPALNGTSGEYLIIGLVHVGSGQLLVTSVTVS